MLELVGVSKQYLYGARLLHSLDMSVANGEIVAILGEEGSGKTTLIKVIGAVTDCEGRVLIDGEDAKCKSDDTIIVFDDLAVFQNRTFYYNLAYPLKIRGYDKQDIDNRVKQAATKLGITACLYEKVRKMPLIDVKRLAIARLFIRDSKLILIDDITNGLNKDDAQILWNEIVPLIIEKAREGVSVIYSTSQKDEAISIANRIVVMHYGEVKQIGSVQEIDAQPSNIWSAQALDCDYHFERAHLSCKNEVLVASVNSSQSDESIDIDISHLKSKIVDSYVDKDVYIGWKSCDYAQSGDRKESVAYSIKCDDGYINVLQSGKRVHSSSRLEKVCTLPNISKVCLFDIASENSIILKERV